MNRVMHFEIGAEDPHRAIEFYTKTFNWEIKKWEGPMDYWLVMTGDAKESGIDGGIYQRDPLPEEPASSQDANTFLCTIEIADIDQAIQKIKENGGEIISDKMEIPSVGIMAYVKDTEGNLFGVMENFPQNQE